MPLRLLKFKTHLPHALEHRLVTHWGYAVEKRHYSGAQGESYLLFKKNYVSDKKDNDEGLKRTIRVSIEDNVIKPVFNAKDFGLTKYQRTQLERRCDNIVDFFPDPYSVPERVRARLTIIQQHLLPAEAEFVQYYMDENFPAS